MKRILLGFFISPLSSGLIQGTIMGNAVGVFYTYLIYALPLSIIFGMPTFIIFKKNNWLKLWHVTLTGFILGMLVSLIYGAIIGFSSFSVIAIIKGILLFGFHGFIVSLTFWLIVLFNSKSSNK